MSGLANVKSIQALADLKSALARYGVDVQKSLQWMAHTIEQTRRALQERQNYWRLQIRRCEEALSHARAAYAHCQNSAYIDYDGHSYVPDCRHYEQQVIQAKRQLDQAMQALRQVEQAIKQVESAIQSYQQQARRLSSFVGNDLKEGQAMLERKISILQGYVAGSLTSGAVGVIPNLLAATSNRSATTGWQELGIVDVPLAQINIDDSTVRGTEDFKKVTHEVMTNGLQKLVSKVRPAVAQGATGDYFSALDAQQELTYEHGYRRVYDAFYGGEPIRLEKVNGRYQVVNGYHRLYVAQQLGLTSIPASVSEPLNREVTPIGNRGEAQ